MEKIPESILTSDRGGIFKINQMFLVCISLLIPVAFIAYDSKGDEQYMKTFMVSFTIALILYKANEYIIPKFKELLIKARLFGKDLNKPGNINEKPPM